MYCLRDTYAPAGHNLFIFDRRAFYQSDRAFGEVMPAKAQIDIERLADFARTIRYILTRHAAPLFYYVQTLNRLHGTD